MDELDPKALAAISRPTMLVDSSRLLRDQRLAEAFFERLKKHIKTAEKEAEAGEQLVVFYDTPAGERIRIEDISWHNPSLIILFGRSTKTEERSRVLVHQESLSLVLRFVRREPETSANPIGFSIEK